jgi:hypothetical protein
MCEEKAKTNEEIIIFEQAKMRKLLR